MMPRISETIARVLVGGLGPSAARHMDRAGRAPERRAGRVPAGMAGPAPAAAGMAGRAPAGPAAGTGAEGSRSWALAAAEAPGVPAELAAGTEPAAVADSAVPGGSGLSCDLCLRWCVRASKLTVARGGAARLPSARTAYPLRVALRV